MSSTKGKTTAKGKVKAKEPVKGKEPEVPFAYNDTLPIYEANSAVTGDLVANFNLHRDFKALLVGRGGSGFGKTTILDKTAEEVRILCPGVRVMNVSADKHKDVYINDRRSKTVNMGLVHGDTQELMVKLLKEFTEETGGCGQCLFVIDNTMLGEFDCRDYLGKVRTFFDECYVVNLQFVPKNEDLANLVLLCVRSYLNSNRRNTIGREANMAIAKALLGEYDEIQALATQNTHGVSLEWVLWMMIRSHGEEKEVKHYFEKVLPVPVNWYTVEAHSD